MCNSSWGTQEVIRHLIGLGADESAVESEISDAEASGAGSIVAFERAVFEYAGHSTWHRYSRIPPIDASPEEIELYEMGDILEPE